MDKFTPTAPYLIAHNGPDANGNCTTIVDASALLYQPAVRAAVQREQAAILATRLALARWTSAIAAPTPAHDHGTSPHRAAFYARAQDDFFAWIGRGGLWEGDDADDVQAPMQNDGAEAVVRTTVLLQRSTPAEE